MDLAPGTLVAGTYEIVGPLGRGGMGELFRARNVRTERRVALKLLRADNKHRADAIERFRREARAAGMINSDHVTQVLDVEDDPELGIAIAFELLEGESLLDRLRRTGTMDMPTIGPLVAQILQGLADAHSAGIIHRDLKPSNIFLEKKGEGFRVKVLDFGISKLPKAIAKTTLTEPGQSLGSFMFMPPEQIQRAASVDHRADIYALGTLVFQAMTGHLPFSARNLVELVQMKTAGRARSLGEATGKPFPPAIEAWVARCLALSPDSRFQSAAEAARAWAALAPEAPNSQPAPSSPWQQGPPSSPGAIMNAAYVPAARVPAPGQAYPGQPPATPPRAPPPGFGRTVPLQGGYVPNAPSVAGPPPASPSGAVMSTAPSVVVPAHLAGPQQRPVPPVLTAQAPPHSLPVSSKKRKQGANTLLWVMAIVMVLAAAVVVAAVAWIVVQRGGI